jgi:hypothetical protein
MPLRSDSNELCADAASDAVGHFQLPHRSETLRIFKSARPCERQPNRVTEAGSRHLS